ncbi:MAG: XRE family transcriptional regulator [Verrucomicrobiae bacterium]|nr:XRE family transcriptional regulator [Verrucomicrobiae bacterium]
MKNPHEQIAENILALLKQRGFKQADLSERTGYSRQRINSYVRAVKRPSPEALMRLADVLNCLPEEIDESFTVIPRELQQLVASWPHLPIRIRRAISHTLKIHNI